MRSPVQSWLHPYQTFWSKQNTGISLSCIDLDDLQSTLKAEISAVQQHYQKSTDAWRSPTPDFKVGDKVFIKTQFF